MGPKRVKAKSAASQQALIVEKPKHKTFVDEDDEIAESFVQDDEGDDQLVQSGQSGRNDSDDDDAPEQISSTHDSVLRLKEFHDSTVAPHDAKKRKKRQRRDEEHRAVILRSDEALDDSVLAAVDEAGQGVGHTDVESDAPSSVVLSTSHLVHAKKSKQIGNIEVSVLDSDSNPLAEYRVSESTAHFMSSLRTSHPRIRSAIFAGQKKAGPAKKFCR